MVLGFLSSVESVTTTKKVRRTSLRRRGKHPKKTNVVYEVKEAQNQITVAEIDDIQPGNIHTLLYKIDQRVKMCETYLVDMTGKMTVPNQILMPPPLPPPLPPPVRPVPSTSLTTLSHSTPTTQSSDIQEESSALKFLQELKIRVKDRKEQADLCAINSIVGED